MTRVIDAEGNRGGLFEVRWAGERRPSRLAGFELGDALSSVETVKEALEASDETDGEMTAKVHEARIVAIAIAEFNLSNEVSLEPEHDAILALVEQIVERHAQAAKAARAAR